MPRRRPQRGLFDPEGPDPAREAALALLRREGARVEYLPGWLPPAEADALLAELRETLVYDPPEVSAVRRPFSDERVAIPRQQVAHGDPGARYSFSGTTVAARPWTPALAALRDRVRARLGFAASYVLVNRYRDGADRIGWHADDEGDLGPEPTIVALSLGATRDLQLRHKRAFARGGRPGARADLPTVTLALEHGSALVLRHPTNRDWKHQLPRRGGAHPERVGERLGLTFRRLV